MSAPRHLWSGDWRTESASAAESLARLRQDDERLGGEPAPELAPARTRLRPVRTRLRPAGTRLRPALAVVVVVLLSAGVAYATVSWLVGSAGGQSPVAAVGGPAWLGVEMGDSGIGGPGFPAVGGGLTGAGGVLITGVAPGSPAAAAGLQAGDTLTQIANQPVATPSGVVSALARMRGGMRVEIQYQQGLMTDTTQATLAVRPAGSP